MFEVTKPKGFMEARVVLKAHGGGTRQERPGMRCVCKRPWAASAAPSAEVAVPCATAVTRRFEGVPGRPQREMRVERVKCRRCGRGVVDFAVLVAALSRLATVSGVAWLLGGARVEIVSGIRADYMRWRCASHDLLGQPRIPTRRVRRPQGADMQDDGPGSP